jgi:hypothetical protein
MAQYFEYTEGTLKYITDPVTKARFRTGQSGHVFVEQEYIGGVWTLIGGYDDIAGTGCKFRQGVRDGDYIVDKELEVGGFLLAEDDGWENIGGAIGGWTPQSLIVEDAAPTNIVMTGLVPNTNLIASDFIITGITATVSSISRDVTNKIITLTLSEDVLIYDENLIVTYRGVDYIVINNVLDDGNTVAWFKYNDMNTIIKDGLNRVNQWTDKTGLGHNLLQATDALKPIWSLNGLLFDGIDDFMKCVGFVFHQPEFIYIVIKTVSWIANSRILEGDNDDTMNALYRTAPPGFECFGGSFLGLNSDLIVGNYSILKILFNGVDSFSQVNNNAPINGNAGASWGNGFTLAAQPSTGLNNGNFQVKEIILRRTADNAAIQTQIYNYLKNANGI